jgi:hypothetical protein
VDHQTICSFLDDASLEQAGGTARLQRLDGWCDIGRRSIRQALRDRYSLGTRPKEYLRTSRQSRLGSRSTGQGQPELLGGVDVAD